MIWVERWWLERQLGGNDRARAVAAAQGLADRGDPAALPALTAAARSGDPGLAEASASAIARIGGPFAEEALLQLLADPHARLAAARAFCTLHYLTSPGRAVAALLAAIPETQDPDTLVQLCYALVAVGDAAAIPAVRGLLDHPDAVTRETALSALTSLGWDPGPEGVAAEAVARRRTFEIGDLGALATGPLLAVLRHPEPGERAWALERLAELPALAPRPELPDALHQLAGEPDLAIHLLLVHVLARAGDARCAETLIKLAQSGQGEVRRAAVGALHVYPSPRVTHVLCRLLADPQVGDEAVEALVGHRPEPQTLLALYDAQDLSLARRVLSVLGGVDTPEVTDHLARLLDDDSPEIRAAAARALGGHPTPDVASTLVERLFFDSNPDTRAAAAQGLRALRPGTETVTFDALAVALRDDPAPDVRATCASVIGERSDHDRIGALVGALDDVEPGVRRAAAFALPESELEADPRLAMRRAVALRSDAEIERVLDRIRSSIIARTRALSAAEIDAQASREGRALTAPALQRVLDHPHPRERVWACDRLARLGTTESATALAPRVDDTDPMVRLAAMRASVALIGLGAAGSLIPRLLDPVTEVQRLAVDLLTRAGWEPDAAGAAVRGVALRDETAVMLAGVRTPRLLATQTQHTDPEQRAWVARMLGRTGHPDAVAPLVSMLDDEERVTINVVRSLQALRWVPGPDDRFRWAFGSRNLLEVARLGAAAVPMLGERIRWPDARSWVVRALGVTQSPDAIPWLEDVLASDQWEPETWSMAVDALSALRWTPTHPAHRVRVAMVRNAWQWAEGIGEEAAPALAPLLGRTGRDAAAWTAQLLERCPRAWPESWLTALAVHEDERELRTLYTANAPAGHDWVVIVDWSPVRQRAARLLHPSLPPSAG